MTSFLYIGTQIFFCIYKIPAAFTFFVDTINTMLTVIETPTFQKQAAAVWSETERLEFITYIAANPTAGDVIQGGNGMRKVRWTVAGKGKRGGARVIYITFMEAGELALLAVYTKAERENILPKEVKRK